MGGPLLGLKVLDLSRLLPGPYATMQMADMGAEVIKVESPLAPDYARMLPPTFEGTSAAFLTLNRNKRSLMVRYDTPGGHEVLRRLIVWADVLVESNRSGFLERLGLGPAAAQGYNPRLVYCSLSGFGQSGRYRDRAGHDLNFLALSGVAASLSPSSVPVVPGLQIADLITGLACVAAVTSALFERSRTGLGRHIDLALADATLGLSVLQQAEQLACRTSTPQSQSPLGGAHPFYRYYRCRDKRWLAVGALEPKFQNGIRQLFPDLDLAGASTWASLPGNPLHTQLEQIFAARTRGEWVEMLGHLDLCVEPVLEPSEVNGQGWLRDRELVRSVITEAGTSIEQPGGIFDGAFRPAAEPGFAAVAAGRHSREILLELGYSEGEVGDFFASGEAVSAGC